jgi:alpha-amylase
LLNNISNFQDYAIETSLDTPHNSEGKTIHEVQIKIDKGTSIAAINFVLKEEETGAWFQHKGQDFRIPLSGSFGGDLLGTEQDIDVRPGALGHLSNVLQKPEGPIAEPHKTVPDDKGSRTKHISGFYEEYPILKTVYVQNFITVNVRENNGTTKHAVEFDTDIPGEVIIHWGVCKDNTMTWEIPPEPHPPATKIFRQKALQTMLQVRTLIPW